MSLASKFIRHSRLLCLSRLCFRQKCIFTKRHIPVRIVDKKLLLPQIVARTFALREGCWRCGGSEKKNDFFCGNCNALQKPSDTYNFFHLFKLEENFDLKPIELSKKFRQLQAILHPDKYSNASDDEKQFSADLSSLVNKAFRTLSDPLERGLYLLSLKGLSIEEGNTSFDKNFLLEVMELNEDLESISSFDELQKFHSENMKTLRLIEQKVSHSFSIQDVDSARASLMKMKYFTSLESKIKEKMLVLGSI